MSAPAWRNNVQHITPGEAVSAGVTGRPDQALDGNTRYLKDRLDAAAYGSLLLDVDATVAPEVLVGQPVFWSSVNQRYEQALAGVETDVDSGTLVPTRNSDAAGLVYSKTNSTLATIVLGGIATLDLSNAVDGDIGLGRYYLSPAVDGKLVQQRPPVTVAICVVQQEVDGGHRVLVLPQLRDFVEDHIHYSFDLVCRPAGETAAPLSGERHTIDTPDATRSGWLPATHSSFNGTAPPRAVFGYNLAAHTALSRVWPPIPITAVSLFWDKGRGYVGGTEVPQGDEGLVIVNADGIWWLSDCYGDVPWPVSSTGDSSSGADQGESVGGEYVPECDRFETMRLVLSYVQMTFATDRSVVTSLAPADGSPLTFVNCDGETATTGDLKAGLNLALLTSDTEAYGGQVLKELITGPVFTRGWVAEGVLVGSDNVQIASTHTRLLDPEDAESAIVYQGLVTITVDNNASGRELTPQIARLRDAKERMLSGIPYLGFPEDRESEVLFIFDVPAAGLPTSPSLTLRAKLFGRATGTLPDLAVTYRRIARPTGTPVPLPTTDTALTFTASVAATGDNPVEIESDAFVVAAGDTVLVSVTREAGDGYAAEVGALRVTAVLS